MKFRDVGIISCYQPKYCLPAELQLPTGHYDLLTQHVSNSTQPNNQNETMTFLLVQTRQETER